MNHYCFPYMFPMYNHYSTILEIFLTLTDTHDIYH